MSGPPDFRLEHSEFRAAGEFASEDLPYHADWRGSLEKLPWGPRHHSVGFANWPIYIDTLKGQHPTLQHFTRQTGIQVSYTEPETDPMPFQPVIGLPPSVTANAPTVFPSQRYTQLSRNYYQFKNQEELSAWNNLVLPITQGT